MPPKKTADAKAGNGDGDGDKACVYFVHEYFR